MFSSSKTPVIKENVSELLDNVRSNVARIAKDTKTAAGKIGRGVETTSKAARNDALVLLDSLREILDPQEKASKLEQFTGRLAEHIADWKNLVQEEILHTFQLSKIESRRFVQKRTMLAFSIALGAGAVIGYLTSGNSVSE
ncbi:MAG TPA: hypothetical protein VIE91_03335 [Methylophilaceae bacterium]